MKTKLEWPDLWNNLGMSKDNGGRWYPNDDAPIIVKEYVSQYRSPSRSWPNSYATPLLTVKFAEYLKERDSELAKQCGLE